VLQRLAKRIAPSQAALRFEEFSNFERAPIAVARMCRGKNPSQDMVRAPKKNWQRRQRGQNAGPASMANRYSVIA
jgi:hypothetical protein